MNNSQKTRKSIMTWLRESSDHETAARIALFRKTDEGTRGMSRDQLATEMVRNGVFIRDAKAAL